MIGYPKVAERIERLIRHRKLRAGDPMPSERELAGVVPANELGVVTRQPALLKPGLP